MSLIEMSLTAVKPKKSGSKKKEKAVVEPETSSEPKKLTQYQRQKKRLLLSLRNRDVLIKPIHMRQIMKYVFDYSVSGDFFCSFLHYSCEVPFCIQLLVVKLLVRNITKLSFLTIFFI